MNILVANWTWYPSGGDWTYVENITRQYIANGHQIIPFSMQDERNFSNAYSSFFISHIDYKKVNKTSPVAAYNVIKKSIWSKEAQQQLEKLLDTVKIDFAHINVIHHYITPIILKTLKERGIPVIWTLHEYTPICPESTFISHGEICEKCKGGAFYHCITNKCKKGSLPASLVAATENYVHAALNCYQYVDHYVCPSEFLYQKFRSFNFFPEKLVQLYHGYDYAEVESATRNLGKAPAQKYIVFAGRLEKIKGPHTLIKAIANHPDIQLRLIGTGTQEAELRQFVAEQQLKNVTFLGKLKRADTLKEIGNAEFLVCPSEWYEVLGFTVVEAMAMGKPVIGSSIGAIPEMVIEGKTGTLFPHGDVTVLSGKIRELYDSPDQIKEMGKNAKAHIHNLINSEKHYAGLQKLIPGL